MATSSDDKGIVLSDEPRTSLDAEGCVLVPPLDATSKAYRSTTWQELEKEMFVATCVGYATQKEEEDLHTPGAKDDEGKLPLSIVPGEAIEAIARVLQFGKGKYTESGWKEVPNAEKRYLDACLRHLIAVLKGEAFDPETGFHHLDHALTNLAFLAYFRDRGGVCSGSG